MSPSKNFLNILLSDEVYLYRIEDKIKTLTENEKQTNKNNFLLLNNQTNKDIFKNFLDKIIFQ